MQEVRNTLPYGKSHSAVIHPAVFFVERSFGLPYSRGNQVPRAIASFGGKFDPRKLTFPYNLVQALKSMPASDVRDWTAICAWASDLATQFQPALAWTSELA